MLFVDIRPRGVRMCRPATDPPTPGWGYGYGQGWINTTRTRTLLYPGGTGTRVQQPVTIPTCHQLDLAYDPSIILNMVSANGNINQSLGLARNVPFQVGSITFYLQVHIIQSPAYDVLLGRPFDILTESIVRNFNNQDQTITISDPNTGRRVTVPTLNRNTKSKHCTHQKEEDF